MVERRAASRASAGAADSSHERVDGAERRRKLIHISTVAVALAVWFLPRSVAMAVTGAAVAVALAVEWARMRHPWARRRFLRRTRSMLREHEEEGLSGATYLAVGYFAVIVLFPRPIAAAAILYGGVGDAVAGLVGRTWGRRTTGWGKSWQGFAGGLVANLAIGLLIPGLGTVAAIAGALAASTLEFLPLPADDNVRTTVGGGAALWLASLGTLPTG